MDTKTTEITPENQKQSTPTLIITPTPTPATPHPHNPQQKDPPLPKGNPGTENVHVPAAPAESGANQDSPSVARDAAPLTSGPEVKTKTGTVGPKEGGEKRVVVPHPHSFHGPGTRDKNGSQTLPLTLNHVAIVDAAQNKLPISKVRAVVTRVGRHTASSAGKLGRWYKGDNYVDNVSYSWRNMDLFVDYQKQMYTDFGAVKATCKK